MSVRTRPQPTHDPRPASCQARIDLAARRMVDAEYALHAARQAHVDEWAAAAYDRLHEAIAAHTAALIEQSTGVMRTTSTTDTPPVR
ncbi:MAG: hypothetical protein JWN95_3198 [Frankiales bacterium]|nr:hypothetical protein [Frankiales bacterium]